jgi:tripartite ATP-independent transporter DctM subunit
MPDFVWVVLAFVLLLAIGVPVAFAIGLTAALATLAAMDAEPALVTTAQRMATGLDSFVLLAIPLFVLAGELMNRGGIARRLIDLARLLLARLPGGLAQVNIGASLLFGALSGSAVAAASAVGGVMAPRMRDEGYAPGFSAAVNITAATTGLLVPPSNILIVYSMASGGVSVAALFLAGYLPGLLVALLLMLTAGWLARVHGGTREPAAALHDGAARLLVRALPSLGLPLLVVGGLIGGVFTATEAAAVAVLYALVLSLLYGELRPAGLPDVLREAAGTTAVVLLLVATSVALSWILAYEQVPQVVSSFLLGLGDGRLAALLSINVLLLVVGTFMDMTPAVLVFTPILLPVVTELGVDPVHFGIVMILNLCIGLCTPPLGSVLFVGCSVGQTSLASVLRPLLPLFFAMLLALVIVSTVPALSLWLPAQFGY